jgi:hypothetical protein
MACVAFAWAAWINLIDLMRKQTKAPGCAADVKPHGQHPMDMEVYVNIVYSFSHLDNNVN